MVGTCKKISAPILDIAQKPELHSEVSAPFEVNTPFEVSVPLAADQGQAEEEG